MTNYIKVRGTKGNHTMVLEASRRGKFGWDLYTRSIHKEYNEFIEENEGSYVRGVEEGRTEVMETAEALEYLGYEVSIKED